MRFIIVSARIYFITIAELFHFGVRFIKEVVRPPFEWKEIARQSYLLGFLSLGLVSITAFILGLVLTIQSRPTLVEFGAESWLPSMVSLSIIREIGPVITALICAGKIGSGIGAELGSMRVTEQIDAMEVSGTNPYKFLVVSRVIATTLMLPLLVILADTIALAGCFTAINLKDSISFPLFFRQVFVALNYTDIFPSVFKSILFGFFIGIIGCFMGYQTKKGTAGVGRSANSAVVTSSLAIFIIDLIIAQLSDLLFEL
ncbi:MlaE family ABC transporter permease [Membranihabitans maritimus]|uniref:MlaE family ABC transporter permease n=1 Tax=Membranihabitans maritimus TaxID=2904244 RepID=UPI001F3C0D44|nr:ABC transporter permease [Membranihabitans maritimus]